MRCHVPSFVSDFVSVDAWIDEETKEEYREMGGPTGELLRHIK